MSDLLQVIATAIPILWVELRIRACIRSLRARRER